MAIINFDWFLAFVLKFVVANSVFFHKKLLFCFQNKGVDDMIKRKHLMIFFIVATTVLFFSMTGCCSKEIQSQKLKTGVIQMTGHEPFANLTLLVSDSESYLLECKGEIKEKLMENQGRKFSIEFSEIKEELKHKILVVTKASIIE